MTRILLAPVAGGGSRDAVRGRPRPALVALPPAGVGAAVLADRARAASAVAARYVALLEDDARLRIERGAVVAGDAPGWQQRLRVGSLGLATGLMLWSARRGRAAGRSDEAPRDHAGPVGELRRRLREVLGASRDRATPVPGLVDLVAPLVASAQRAELDGFLDGLPAELLPRVLHACSLGVPARVGPGAPSLPVIDAAPAMRRLDPVIAWWMSVNPTLMQRPLEDLVPHLAQYLDHAIADLEHDRGAIVATDLDAPD